MNRVHDATDLPRSSTVAKMSRRGQETWSGSIKQRDGLPPGAGLTDLTGSGQAAPSLTQISVVVTVPPASSDREQQTAPALACSPSNQAVSFRNRERVAHSHQGQQRETQRETLRAESPPPADLMLPP